MTLSVAYAALASGVIVWLILVRKLSTKSWEAQPATTAAEPSRIAPARIGLWVFLAVVTSLFGLFVSAYYMRMAGHGHGGAAPVHDWVAIQDPPILWFNTLLLILGSLAMQAARTAVKRGSAGSMRKWLQIGGFLTLAFLGGQYFAWSQIRGGESFTVRNPAIAFFYVLTAVHGLHLLGGLYVWGRTLRRMQRKDAELIDVGLSVELCSVYWHYLLLVWLGLFAILLST